MNKDIMIVLGMLLVPTEFLRAGGDSDAPAGDEVIPQFMQFSSLGWNDFLAPLIYLNKMSKYTLSLSIFYTILPFQMDWGGRHGNIRPGLYSFRCLFSSCYSAICSAGCHFQD